MNNAPHIQNIQTIFKQLLDLDKKLIFKQNLGDESLTKDLEADFQIFIKRVEQILEYGKYIPAQLLEIIHSTISDLISLLGNIAKLKTADYISQRGNYIRDIKNNFNNLENKWPSIISYIIEAKGFLYDDSIKSEYDKLMHDLQVNAKNTLAEIRNESEKILKEAKEIANQIETRARKTATKLSVEDAQNQFKEAQLDHLKSVKLWTWLSLISLALFVGIASAFYFDLPKLEEGLMIYKTVIRATILISIGAVATFCLKILRSSYHMYKHNQHRQRIANSIGSFVESAVTPEQRDLILTHLVESIANFGNSGLVHGDDDNINASKFVVDNLIRNISPKN